MQISIATYSLKKLITKEKKSFEEIAKIVKEMGVNFIEINNLFVASNEESSEKSLKNVCKIFTDNGVTPILLTIDGNNYFQSSQKKRKEQFDFMRKWIDSASDCGISIIRANMGRPKFGGKPRNLKLIYKTFKPILDYCKKKNIIHTFENHGTLSSDVEFQLMVKERFPEENMGYLLDFGNYRPKELVYENIAKLGKSIKICHGKMYNFDENGLETRLDIERIINELKKIGFDGFISVEFEGPLPPLEGTRKSVELLKRFI